MQKTRRAGALSGFLKELIKNKALFLMLLPGLLLMLINNYIPMVGVFIAFKNIKYSAGNFIVNLINSENVGFKNFEYFTKGTAAYEVTRNTVLYNLAFISLGLIFSVGLAIALNEIRNRRLMKFYQNVTFLPFFLSWVVVSYLVYAFLNPAQGYANMILNQLGFADIDWYTEPGRWPIILIIVNLWKNVGYSMVLYLAAIMGINRDYYEAAEIDGANRWKQIIYITIPFLKPLMVTLTLLAIGKIFYSDFGLFFQITRNNGPLYSTTQTLDTFVYNSLIKMGDIGMASAAGLYQAVIGFVLVVFTNMLVKRYSKDNALF
ncbi:sugar ABC transporter permease [Paenibacillus swuensis]|uniref:Sugar ABC transporter permease n=1 Tax=Paenibacillus swuensis TaxID=1178515 RepID=A0A172TDZ5_9BACL|nr:ABC transporter permease subunit [Paenibacillus swuensis]ANE45230.1 sugar ABC transporter permease [Paenibacillus swuensis]